MLKSLFFIVLFLAVFLPSEAQINIKIISRADSSSIIGSCSDTHIRIENLPLKSFVNIDRGAIVHVKDDEYVLCRFGSCIEKNTIATVAISNNGKTVFSKQYSITHTNPSGSIYNPILSVDTKNSVYGKHKDSIAFKDFPSFLTNGLSLSDTKCKIALNVAIYNRNEIYGPYPVGQPYYFLVDGAPKDRSFNTLLMDKLKNIEKGSILFFDCIIATGPGGGFYEVNPQTIYLR